MSFIKRLNVKKNVIKKTNVKFISVAIVVLCLEFFKLYILFFFCLTNRLVVTTNTIFISLSL